MCHSVADYLLSSTNVDFPTEGAVNPCVALALRHASHPDNPFAHQGFVETDSMLRDA